MSNTPSHEPSLSPRESQMCTVLAEMASILDENFNRRDVHNTRRELMLEKLIRHLSWGIAMVGLVSLLMGALLFKLIYDIHTNMETMTNHMDSMRDSFFMVQSDIRVMTQHIIPMQQDIALISNDFQSLNKQITKIDANMNNITSHIQAMETHTSSMANTITRMQYEISGMRFGVQSMSHDTYNLSSPWRWMSGQ